MGFNTSDSGPYWSGASSSCSISSGIPIFVTWFPNDLLLSLFKAMLRI
jgi:hypothetical protein